MKRLMLLLGALALSLGFITAAGPPASADTCTFDTGLYCGVMKHYSPDDGYDPGIKIRCNFGDASTNHLLLEGEKSTKYCQDMDQYYVRDGEELWCKYQLYNGDTYQYYDQWIQRADATGWYKWSNGQSDGYGCTLRED